MVGGTVEWMVEAPSHFVYPLADFITAEASSIWASPGPYNLLTTSGVQLPEAKYTTGSGAVDLCASPLLNSKEPYTVYYFWGAYN